MVRRIVVATHNRGKIREIEHILADEMGSAAAGFEFITSEDAGLPDPRETGITFQENALLKARDAAQRTGLPAMADDSGLIVDVMGNAPGILSARWSGAHGDDAANNTLLLAQLADIPGTGRSARFRCTCALVVPHADGAGNSGGKGSGAAEYTEYVETGEMPGRIARSPRGSNGFGYDPLFIPDDQSRVTDQQRAQNNGQPLTSAQMTPEQKDAISHRGAASRAMAAHFAELA